MPGNCAVSPARPLLCDLVTDTTGRFMREEMPAEPTGQWGPAQRKGSPLVFKTNEGTADRAVRIIAGVVLLALFFLYPDASWRYWTLIGIVPLLTGLVGTCPLYSILGISTCPMKKV